MARLIFTLILLVFLGFFLLPSGSKKPHKFYELSHQVEVEWLQQGVPRIRAFGLSDAYFIQGYLTARDRFFQMELTRRKMAGELSEVFGSKALSSDIAQRRWNFSKIAQLAVEKMHPEKRQLLEAFSHGVNESLRDEGVPWELKVLGVKPAPWKPEDCFLVVLSMYDSLNKQEESQEEAVFLIQKQFSPSVLSFFTLDWGFLDTPIVPDPPLQDRLPPPPSEFKIKPNKKASFSIPSDSEPGSNAWVMSGKLTDSGKPLLASDPHLDLRVPNLWYRLGISSEKGEVFGASIPGVPGIVIGRNQKTAWAFTNSAVDNSDQIRVSKSHPGNHFRKEFIPVKNEESHEVQFTDTLWGPVLSETDTEYSAVHWTALDPENLKDLDLSGLNSSSNIKELLSAFHQWAGPPQNAIFATQSGDIGWTLAGRVPKRKGFDGSSRVLKDPKRVWEGYFASSEIPVVLNPAQGFLVSANQRSVPPTDTYRPFGNDWPNSARAKRITELLNVSRKWTAQDFLSIQRDTLSLTHLWYRDELLKCPKAEGELSSSGILKTAYSLVRDWDGHASLDSSAYPIMKQFRFSLFKNLIQPIAHTISPEKESILFSRLSNDFLLTRIISSQKGNFLPASFSSYCELLIHSFKETVDDLGFSATHLSDLKWGELNQSHIQHPFSRILPAFLQPLLNLPQKPMPGDYLVPNVMTPTNGASMRLVVDFSNPAHSLFSQPGGQSGSVFSSHYRDSYPEWIEGKALPFEPVLDARVSKEVFHPG